MSAIAAPIPLFEVRQRSISKCYYATDWANVKIGRTLNPRRRGGELRATMLYVFDGDLQVERQHHAMWAAHRIGTSEWFRPVPQILHWLALNGDDHTRRLLRQFEAGLGLGATA